MDVIDLLRSCDGVATWKLLRPYVTPRELADAVSSGRVVKRGRGTYCLIPAANRAAARSVRGVLSHLSAAEHWQLGVLADPTTVDVTIAPDRSRVTVPDGVRIHYSSVPAEQNISGVTDVVRTVVDCARGCDLPQAMAVADTALRLGRATETELATAAGALRGPGAGRARRVVGWADRRAASVMESALRGILLDAGITGFQPQYQVGYAHADLGDPQSRTLIEADSFMWHTQKHQLVQDAERYDEFVAAGYAVLRFTWPHIMNERAWVLDIVRRTLACRNTGATAA